jgi:hypothetical protein
MEIYKITNLINNKIYIGKDTTSDKNYYGSGILIKKSIKKYGKENFKKEILEECDTNDKLCDREKYWINFYNSTNLTIGYNISKGGDGGDTLSNNPNINEIKSKISKFRKGKKYEDILPLDKVLLYKQKLSISSSDRLKGKTLEDLYGIERAKEIKEKLSNSQKNRQSNLPKKIKINITKEEKVFNNLKLKYQKINDINTLKKRYFQFRHRNNVEFFIKIIGVEKYEKILNSLKKPFRHKKETINLMVKIKIDKFIKEKNNLIEFLMKNPTLTRNDYYNNLTSKQVSIKTSKFLRGKFSKFLTEEEKNLIKKINKKNPIISKEKLLEKKIKLSRPIIIEGKNYISASEASKILNIDRGTIRFRIKSEKYPNYEYL